MNFSVIRKSIIITGILVPVIMLAVLTLQQNQTLPVSAQKNLPVFTTQKLSQFNGNTAEKPIYLGLDGFVYDVTKGRTFYEKGGPYHYLAGKDATVELHIAGGGIIKRKYPIIGILKK